MLTVASGTAAPLASLTVPLMLPRPCCAAAGDARSSASNATLPRRRLGVSPRTLGKIAPPGRGVIEPRCERAT
jgi:hypothetical protein